MSLHSNVPSLFLAVSHPPLSPSPSLLQYQTPVHPMTHSNTNTSSASAASSTSSSNTHGQPCFSLPTTNTPPPPTSHNETNVTATEDQTRLVSVRLLDY